MIAEKVHDRKMHDDIIYYIDEQKKQVTCVLKPAHNLDEYGAPIKNQSHLVDIDNLIWKFNHNIRSPYNYIKLESATYELDSFVGIATARDGDEFDLEKGKKIALLAARRKRHAMECGQIDEIEKNALRLIQFCEEYKAKKKKAMKKQTAKVFSDTLSPQSYHKKIKISHIMAEVYKDFCKMTVEEILNKYDVNAREPRKGILFPNGVEFTFRCMAISIKDIAWQKAVLLDEKGNIIGCSESLGGILGHWDLKDIYGNQYHVTIEEKTS